MIYLDNAATTCVDPLVRDAMMPYFENEFGNPGAVYDFSQSARDAVDTARQDVAGFLHCAPEHVIFTSGGSEANSMVFRGLIPFLREYGKKTVLISAVEHDSVLRAAASMEEEGFTVKYIPVDKRGKVDIEKLTELLEEGYGRIGLVSVMYVNNETGSVNPVEKISGLCHTYGALFHTDCVQAAANLPLDCQKINCDFLSVSSHKLHGPKGVGALYAKSKNILRPLIYGGAFQEFGLRGGTENVPGIFGFGTACNLYWVSDIGISPRYVENLSDVFIDTLIKELIKHDLFYAHINGEDLTKGRRILNLRFDGIDAETLVLMMATRGVYISAGAACTSHESTPSHVLLAMGLTEQEARESVRISFSKQNTIEDAERAAKYMAWSIVLIHGAEL